MADDNGDGRMFRAALKYIALGWYVFPLATSGDVKEPHPMLGKKGGHNHGTIDINVARGWWTRSPIAGIGLNLAKSGLIAVDCDPRHGGTATLARFEREKGSLASAVVNLTGGGGFHRLFLAPPGLRGAPGRIGPPKSGLDLKYNGYVVLPPSLWAGRDESGTFLPPSARYRWEAGHAPFDGGLEWLTPIPAWVLHEGSEPAGRTGPAGEDEDVFREDTPVVGLTIEEMRAHLELVPNTGDDELDYEDWTQVLAGIYHETDGSAEGQDLAREWSERAMKHRAEAFDKKWPSFRIEGKGRAPVTFRFVLKLANDRRRVIETATVKTLEGRIVEAPDVVTLRSVALSVKTTELDPLFRNVVMNQVRKRYKLLTGDLLPIADARGLVRYEDPEVRTPPAWLEGWVYCSLDDKFFRVGTNETIVPKAFNALNNVHMLSRKDILEGRANPEILASDAALNRFEIPKVHGRMYLPGEDPLFRFQGSLWFNTYSDSSVPAMPDRLSAADQQAIQRVERHFGMLVPHEDERGLVLSWLAYIVQTRKRPNWAPVIQGPEANGKSFVGAMMGAILGSENVRIIFANTIQSSDFNSWAEGALLNVIEEVKQHSQNRHVIMDRLQVNITNDVIEIHKKRETPYNARNTAAYLLLTNHRDALPIGAGDTRYFLTASRYQTPADIAQFKKANPDYFTELFEIVDDRAGALRHWLTHLELSPDFNPRARAPRSREHAHAVRLNTSDTYYAVGETIRPDGTPGLTPALIDATALAEAVAESGNLVPHTRTLPSILLDLGYTHLGRFKVDGELRRYWTSNPLDFGDTETSIKTRIREILEPSDHGL